MVQAMRSLKTLACRWYWNRLYKRAPETYLNRIMDEFSAFLRVAHDGPSAPSEPSGPCRAQELPVRFQNLAPEGLGPVTVEGYIKMLRKFVRDTGEICPCRETITAAMMSFHKREMSFSHVRNFRVAMEWYMKFWDDPIQLLKAKKPQRAIREFLTEEEVRKLLSATKNLREQAIVATLAYSGVRAKELCRLKPSDVSFENKNILVREGKGLKDRIVCISAGCMEILRKYIEEVEIRCVLSALLGGPGR